MGRGLLSDSILETVRDRLGEDKLTAALEEGRALATDDAMELALS
jgi:hypothetical protein